MDEAQKAGLTAPNAFGGVDTKKFIIETTGTGVAIFDYDNDGWSDIFVVNGTTLDPLPGTKLPTNHLYLGDVPLHGPAATDACCGR